MLGWSWNKRRKSETRRGRFVAPVCGPLRGRGTFGWRRGRAFGRGFKVRRVIDGGDTVAVQVDCRARALFLIGQEKDQLVDVSQEQQLEERTGRRGSSTLRQAYSEVLSSFW